MFQFLKGSKSTIPIIIAVVVIGLLVFIYFIGRRSAKMKVEQVPLPQDQPGGILLSQADAEKVNKIAVGLHDDMNGVAWSVTHESEPYELLLGASDTVFVAVYNHFNKLYSEPKNPTLREWLVSEFSSPFVNNAYHTIKNMVINRIDRLNLK